MSLQLSRISTVLLPVLLFPLLACAASPQYSVSILNTSGYNGAYATAINDAGLVAGKAINYDLSENYVAFTATTSSTSYFGNPLNQSDQIRSINNSGQTAGFIGDQYINSSGYLRSGGTFTTVYNVPGRWSVANDVNDSGSVVGVYLNGVAEHAYVYSNGSLTDLGDFSAGQNLGSTANAINNSGVIVGDASKTSYFDNAAFVYQNGALVNLNTLVTSGSANLTSAKDINNNGQIIATGVLNGKSTSYIYDNGQLTELTGLKLGTGAFALDINDAGHVIGTTTRTNGSAGFFFYHDGVMEDLGSLLTIPSGWSISSLAGLNNNDQIAATLCGSGSCVAARFDLTSPVPEPETYSMLAAGLVMFGAAARRGRKNAPTKLV